MLRWVLVLLILLSGCTCSKKTDEEILKERIDTTSVHLYLATKVAIIKADQSPEAKAAYDKLLRALETKELSAGDVLALAKALYELKSEGEELLESGEDMGMKPVLLAFYKPHDELSEVFDLNFEHAMFLTGMFALRFHPESPAPIPPEIMLYEAWMTDSSKLKLPGIDGLIQAEKAVVYGTNELCDLAAKEAGFAEKSAQNAADIAASLEILTGEKSSMTPEDAKNFNAGIRALSHGVTAMCYRKRDEHDKAVEQFDKALQAAEDMGVPPGELALARAYVAFERKDHATAKKHLATARDYDKTDPETKKDIEAIIANIEDDPGIFDEKLGKAFFTINLARIILRQLDKAGFFDGVKESKLVKTLDGFLGTTAKSIAKAKDTLSGKGLVDDAKGLVDDD